MTTKKKKITGRKSPALRPIGLFRSVIDGSFFSRDEFIRSLPFISFVALLGILYIANTYYAEKTVEKIDKGKKELNLLRNDFVSTRSTLMHTTRQSEVAKKLIETGIVETKIPPGKIIVTKK